MYDTLESTDKLYQAGYVKGLEDALKACQSKDGPNWSTHWRNGIASCVLAIQQLLKRAKAEDAQGVDGPPIDQ